LAPEETPELIQNGLLQLESHLQMIPVHAKTAYLRSQELFGSNGNETPTTATTTNSFAVAARTVTTAPATYVNDPQFRLRFLRSELFDAKKAADRMVKFLDLLHDYYGLESLKRPIQLTDFSKEEMEVLKAGNHQLLPFRDRSGRRIIAVVTDMGLKYPIHDRVRRKKNEGEPWYCGFRFPVIDVSYCVCF
jgi:hypothetical protein